MTSPVLAREQPDGSRMYEHPITGEIAPSVTTIIDAGIPKPALTDWAAKMAARYAVKNWAELEDLPPPARTEEIWQAHIRYTDQRKATGDQVHNAFEAQVKGSVPDCNGIGSHLTQLAAFMMSVRPQFTESEVTVWSRRHGYAGTADWIAEIDGELVMGDTKTGNRIYPEVALQLNALAGADFIIRPDGTEEEMPPVARLMALHLRPRSWRLIPVSASEEHMTAFLACRRIWHWSKEIAPLALEGMR